MTMEAMTRPDQGNEPLQWTPVFAGAIGGAALSFIFLTFAIAVGLGVSSASPTWRDTSAALAILSGIYLILQALVSFGFGGYIAGRTRRSYGPGQADDVENRDGLHGLSAWALSVLLGAALAAVIGASALNRSSPVNSSANTSA